MAESPTQPSLAASLRAPIYLLADSQLLFWKPDGKVPFLDSALQYMAQPPGKAAYVGASNADRPEFYALFVAAMSEIGISECCHVHAALPAAEAEFLAAADLILLAGGDTELGLRTLRAHGVAELVTRRYHAGCVLLGVSAGAVQLGRSVIVERDAAASELLPGLGLVPFVVDAHQEASGWSCLSRTVRTLEGAIAGLGIPGGGGLLFHPDGTLEPVRTWAHEFTHTQGELRHRMLVPAAAEHKSHRD
jgi:cyanophycinase